MALPKMTRVPALRIGTPALAADSCQCLAVRSDASWATMRRHTPPAASALATASVPDTTRPAR